MWAGEEDTRQRHMAEAVRQEGECSEGTRWESCSVGIQEDLEVAVEQESVLPSEVVGLLSHWN